MTDAKKNLLQGYGPLITAVVLLVTVVMWGADLKGDSNTNAGHIVEIRKAAVEMDKRQRLIENATIQMATDIRWMRERIEDREKETPND